MTRPTLHVVHCVDTEGPLTEALEATFERLAATFAIDMPATAENLIKLQQRQVDLGGREDAVAQMIAPELLAYNSNWQAIRTMLEELMSEKYRRQLLDDFGNGWVYSWHCVDHMHFPQNLRQKDVGYGKIFRFYRQILQDTNSTQDELNWHFHPVSIRRNPLHAATSYTNSLDILAEVLCRRILEDEWFPVVNRPGFHAERPDSHAFLEQWIPFDYANQACEEKGDQPDLVGGRFGDWRRAPLTWRGYRPDHDDYQRPGSCRRTVFRCLNVGTRLRTLKPSHVREAFSEAQASGCAILAFADHDYRDIRPDVEAVRTMLQQIRPEFPEVALRFSGAEAAARALLGVANAPPLRMSMDLRDNRLIVRVREGRIFGPQPFLALSARGGRLFHDNFDVQVPGRVWSYVLDEQTLPLSLLTMAGVGAAGHAGGFHTVRLEFRDDAAADPASETHFASTSAP